MKSDKLWIFSLFIVLHSATFSFSLFIFHSLVIPIQIQAVIQVQGGLGVENLFSEPRLVKDGPPGLHAQRVLTAPYEHEGRRE
jgi:hypothetical protein